MNTGMTPAAAARLVKYLDDFNRNSGKATQDYPRTHLRPSLPAAIIDAGQFGGRVGQYRLALAGGAALAAVAVLYPGPVAPFTALINQCTGVYSAYLAAAGLGALHYACAEYIHGMLMPPTVAAVP
ncbi:hypothetical protein T492DRAFT_889087 [Pavlovales sp. CCMP2436]|nr:hypothetical protein T492DRAFT_889087 [Pavlovales sp. CCMP2436]